MSVEKWEIETVVLTSKVESLLSHDDKANRMARKHAEKNNVHNVRIFTVALCIKILKENLVVCMPLFYYCSFSLNWESSLL